MGRELGKKGLRCNGHGVEEGGENSKGDEEMVYIKNSKRCACGTCTAHPPSMNSVQTHSIVFLQAWPKTSSSAYLRPTIPEDADPAFGKVRTYFTNQSSRTHILVKSSLPPPSSPLLNSPLVLPSSLPS